MSKIAILITDLFEDSEYEWPAEAFSKAGHEIITLGLEAAKEVTGKKEGTKVTIDKAVGDVSINDFDALLIPGGYSPDKLRVNDPAVRFVQLFVESGKPVFTICHGPQLLINAQVLEGRTITGWKSIIQDIKNAGAKFVDQDVVEDGNIISSRRPDDLAAFTEKCLEKLR
jgi:protease I